MRYCLIIIVICSLSLSCRKDNPEPEVSFINGWNENLSLTINGQIRYFRVYQPSGLVDKAPVVILLHGGGQNMSEMFNVSAGGSKVWTEVADEEKFLLVAPNGFDAKTNNANGSNQNWNDCRLLTPSNDGYSNQDDVAFINQLIEWTKKSFRVDDSRFYVTGASNGGMMSYRLASELNSKIAAIASFIANIPDPSECNSLIGAMPVMICVGTQDPLMPYTGGNVAGTNRGSVKSAVETISFWLSTNGVSPTDVVITNLPDINPSDNSTVIKRVYGSSTPQKEIEFYVVAGGGHCMPSIVNPLAASAQALVGNQNQDMEGARVAWNFLKKHSRK